MRALLLAILLVLCACQPPLDRGYVTDKKFTPAHSTTVLVPQYTTTCRTVNNITTCTQQLLYFLPITTHYPDTWRIRVENGDREEWIVIPQEEYEATMVNEFWERQPSPGIDL